MESTKDVTKLKLALVTGGWSDEREIALSSAHACEKALREAGFEDIDFIDVAEKGFAARLESGGYDVAFVAMHGRWGEDGCIQGLLECLHIPYTFSDVLASARAGEKEVAKQAYAAAGVQIARGCELKGADIADAELHSRLVDELGLPLFVKPANNGSSYGITRVAEASQMEAAIALAAEGDSPVLVEECVQGMDVTAPVLGNDDAQPLPVIEIVTGAEFYDLKVKYEPSELHHVIPARLDGEVYARVQEAAVAAHRALGCRGASRSDFIVRDDGTPVILETNTIPGMTETSLLPDAARHAGISFPELCRRLVELALE